MNHRFLSGGDDHSTSVTDDHSSSSSTSIFGSLLHLDTKWVTVFIIIIVVSVLLFEKAFELLHEFTADTEFDKMISVLEKELMNVGVTAFIIKIIIFAEHNISHNILIALEYADVLVPIFSFCNCAIGLLLIYSASKQCEIWGKAYYLELSEMLDGFYSVHETISYRLTWNPINTILSELEFRLFHNIFCETYNIRRSALSFDDYVNKVYQDFILSTIKIGPLNWFIFCCILLLNLVRTEFRNKPSSSNRKGYFRNCNKTESECTDENIMFLFFFGGCLIYALTCILCVFARRYELIILRRRGINSPDMYSEFLRKMEVSVVRNHEDDHRFNAAEVKQSILQEKAHRSTSLDGIECSSHGNNGSIHRKSGSDGRRVSFQDFISTPTSILNDVSSALLPRLSGSGSHRNTSSIVPVNCNDNSDSNFLQPEASIFDGSLKTCKMMDNDVRTFTDAATSNDLIENEMIDEEKLNEASTQNDKNNFYSGGISSSTVGIHINSSSSSMKTSTILNNSHNKSVDRQLSSNNNSSRLNIKPKTRLRRTNSLSGATKYVFVVEKAEELRNNFLFSSPDLYFRFVQAVILVLSLYSALWATNFVITAEPLWKFLCALPVFMSIINYLYVIKSAALLKAMLHVDYDAILEVIELNEGSKLLSNQIRELLTTRIEVMGGDAETQMKEMLQSTERKSRDSLSRKEFIVFMDSMGVQFSKKKWNQIFHEIDRNFDDTITFEELFIFLYPEKKSAQDMARKRLNKIRKRVHEHRKRIKKNILTKQRNSIRRFTITEELPPVVESVVVKDEVLSDDELDDELWSKSTKIRPKTVNNNNTHVDFAGNNDTVDNNLKSFQKVNNNIITGDNNDNDNDGTHVKELLSVTSFSVT
eukprot:gene4478-6329_t